ncbi:MULTISPECIES: AAA family ATPase [unclassified Bradyrhizobium]|uniref:AAA family ATPase n=1 Tax=unclassified Bradyrhizobium TaxID=2631580 RepID=UPI0015C96DCD|nr:MULTISPECIES: AAA family ATPase [unclassified Bradyrhizobium]MBB4261418.1 RecA-family ATPase [Bradyrhizobium sp. CIR3A]NYG47668.1 RecA-family ATPase [Bradyrhizobium sp. IAR9]
MPLEPDREQLETFADAIFRRAGEKGFVTVRSFLEEGDRVFRITPAARSGGLKFLVEVCVDDARRAAQNPVPAVFCPPLAVFVGKDKAREEDLLEGLALSVECDQQPSKARAILEGLLGPATVVVRSGGTWANGGTAPEDKLHLHWRLKIPATGKSLAILKKARDLAARLVGGDPSNKPVCHPIRWPGSWHRKAEPRLCTIEQVDADVEIDLEEALATLQIAAPPEPPKAKFNGTALNDGSEWLRLVRNIITGTNYHSSLVALAARLVGSQMYDGSAVTLLRALMSSSTAPHDTVRWQARLDAIPRIVRSAREKYQQDESPPAGPLPFIDMQPWDTNPAPPRPWAVTDRIPIGQPTLFSGEGAAGKTLVELQLCVAHVIGRDWLGGLPECGPAIYYGAEDDADELHRRLTAITDHYGVKFSDLIDGGLHLLSFAGEDAVLAVPDRQGKVQPTPLFERLLEAAADIRPKHIGIDATADTFAGNEIDRSQVRQFVGLMRKLAITANGSVVLLAHPSLTGINSGTGLSGSTAWHNSVRARMLLKTVQEQDGDGQSASDLRELSFLKNNYGPLSDAVVLRYQNGLFLPVAGQSTLEKLAREQKIDGAFLDVLGKLTRQNRPVSPSAHASNYAPKIIAGHPDGKPYTQRDYRAALERLLAADRIHIASFGPPSKTIRHLAPGPADSGDA